MATANEKISIRGCDINIGNVYYFHCYTDNRDEYTQTLEDAVAIVRSWNREGLYNIRIELCISDSVEDYGDGISEDNTILSYGNFPA